SGGCITSAAVPNLIYRTLNTTKYYTASSSATDNKAFHFNNGFVSSGASSTETGILNLGGALNASSTAHITGNIMGRGKFQLGPISSSTSQDISVNSNAATAQMLLYAHGTGNAPNVTFLNSGGTNSHPLPVSYFDVSALGAVNFGGYDG